MAGKESNNQSEKSKPVLDDREPIAPDGGWGWVILAGSFLTRYFIIYLFIYVFITLITSLCIPFSTYHSVHMPSMYPFVMMIK